MGYDQVSEGVNPCRHATPAAYALWVIGLKVIEAI